MPWRKDQSGSPSPSPSPALTGSPSRSDSSARAWGWMKGKFHRTASGRFKKLANDESQEQSVTTSSTADSAIRDVPSLPSSIQPSSPMSFGTTVIDSQPPTSDLATTTDSHVEHSQVDDIDYFSPRDEMSDDASEKLQEEQSEWNLKIDKGPSKVPDVSDIVSSPKGDIEQAEIHVSQNEEPSTASATDPIPTYQHQMEALRNLPLEKYELCKQVLSVASLLYRPVTLSELALLAELPSKTEKEAEGLVGECRDFLAIDEQGTVKFVQQSAKEYLLNEVSLEIFPGGVAIHHRALFSRSLQAMAISLKRDIYDLQEPGTLTDEVKTPSPDPLRQVRYACAHWLDHLRRADSKAEDFEQGGLLGKFLQRDYLHWIEALSLLRSLSAGVSAMFHLEKMVMAHGISSPLYHRTRDAYQFIQHHKPTIEQSPLQVYYSALIFSPIKSITRNQFGTEIANWIELKSMVVDDWSPCLVTLEGHEASVQAVSWASDDRIVSTSYDGTAKLWDSSTNTCLATFKGDDTPISSAGWMGNSTVGLVLGDGRIEAWRATSDVFLSAPIDGRLPYGEDILSFKDGVELFVAASWSSEGTLAFAAEDGSIWIHHNVGMARQQRAIALKGYHTGAAVLAWSHDGRLASGAKDGSMKLWNVADGRCTQELGGHSESIHALSWSRDNQRLASVSQGRIIKIWETKKGRCTAWVQGQSNHIRSLAWSSDGRLAGADGETIKIWDGKNGKCLSKLEGHTHQVWSIAWSEDGTKLASASRDKTVKIWDVARDGNEKALLGQSQSQKVKHLAWSADGGKLAAVFDNDTVTIWDVQSGGPGQKLTESISDIHSVVWSKDGTKLAFAAGYNIVSIWDIVTGAHAHTLVNETGDVKSVAWSEDGTKLVSMSADHQTNIWDVSNGESLGEAPQDNPLRYPSATESFGSTPINSDDAWIVSGGKRQVKLPPGYDVECSASSPERISIGCGSGHVLAFGIPEAASV